MSPETFGRWLPPKEFVLFVAAVIARGKPSLKLDMPEICQPPTMFSTILFDGASFLPFPTGNS